MSSFLESFLINKTILIAGDFNVPNYPSDSGSKVVNLRNFINILNARQFSELLNYYRRHLDLVLSNVEVSVEHSSDLLVSEDSYHPALELKFSLNTWNITIHNFV